MPAWSFRQHGCSSFLKRWLSTLKQLYVNWPGSHRVKLGPAKEACSIQASPAQWLLQLRAKASASLFIFTSHRVSQSKVWRQPRGQTNAKVRRRSLYSHNLAWFFSPMYLVKVPEPIESSTSVWSDPRRSWTSHTPLWWNVSGENWQLFRHSSKKSEEILIPTCWFNFTKLNQRSIQNDEYSLLILGASSGLWRGWYSGMGSFCSRLCRPSRQPSCRCSSSRWRYITMYFIFSHQLLHVCIFQAQAMTCRDPLAGEEDTWTSLLRNGSLPFRFNQTLHPLLLS